MRAQKTHDSRNLAIFGKLFAPINTVDSTAFGYYEPASKGNVRLYTKQKQLEALVVNNRAQGQFVVSASIQQGQARYMFSTCSLTEKWLGIESMGLMDLTDRISEMKYIDRPTTVSTNDSH